MSDERSLGEKMNLGMGLDPGFSLEKPGLIDSVREMSDDTMKRAQHNVDQQRQNKADVEQIAAEIAAEQGLPATLPPLLDADKPSMDVKHLHEYPKEAPPAE
jgi:hypothetical protein